MKKSTVTQELVNIFPPESRVRTSDLSVGQQLLNVMAVKMERMEKELQRNAKNEFLLTANLDEPDLMHKVLLPPAFDFDIDTSDPLLPSFIPPTVLGTIGVTTYAVASTAVNTLEEVWFNTLPSRLSLHTVVSGVSENVINSTVSGILPWTGSAEHHLGGGSVFIELTSGINYITQTSDNDLKRGQVVITGVTRKGSEVSEHIIFPWDQTQKCLNDWKTITKIEGFNLEDEININVTTGNFQKFDYISQWNLRYSQNRKKIDEFWGLGETKTTLDRIEYNTDEWQQLIQGIGEKDSKQKWEMLDSGLSTVSGLDVALQPFTDRAWVLDTGGMLYIYDMNDSMPENMDFMRDRTFGSHVQFESDFREVVLGEDINFIPWHARPLTEINKYRIWYIDPAGTKRGLLQGVPVDFASDFWVVGRQLKRTIEDVVSMTTTLRGEYLFALEVILLDGTTQNERTIFRVMSKTPESEYNISSLITGTPLGIDFDSDQSMWIKTSTGYFRINLHHDVMLIDYANKVLYFREDYTEVDVTTDG